jgi:starch synthase
VTFITAKPGRGRSIVDEFTTIAHRRLWHPSLARIGLLEFHPFALTTVAHLLARRAYDVVLSCTFTDAYAAMLARTMTGVPTVFLVNGLPPHVRYVRSLTLGGAVFGRAIRGADEVVSPSAFMQRELHARFGRSGLRLPIPVDTKLFQLNEQRDLSRPVVLCAAALDDRRKGGRLLFRAFDALKATWPRAALHLSSAIAPPLQRALLEFVSPRWRDDVQFLGTGRLEDLPLHYASAAISVLPSHREPFGMVILESLAAGTPVVASRSGAIPELLDDPAIGSLFDPGPETTVEPENLHGLVKAMHDGLVLAGDPGTARRCRARAETFNWDAIGPRYEQLLTGLRTRSAAPLPRARRAS